MSTGNNPPRTCRTFSAWTTFAVLVFLGLALAAPVAAGDDEFEQEIRAAQERYHTLMQEAKALEERGHVDEARAHFREAQELGNRIEKALSRRNLEREEEERRAREEPAQGERPHLSVEEVKKILKGLEHGMNALRALRRMDALEQLEKIAAGLKRELAQERDREGGETERKVALRQVEVMRRALAGLAEGERRDAAHRLEQAIHAHELRIAGRGDEEAIHVYEQAPDRGEIAELLGLAAELFADWGHEDDAKTIGALARKFARGGERRGGERERDVARRRLEIMRLALEGLQRAERGDAAGMMEHAIHALELALEGERGEEAVHVRRTAPGKDAQAELLALASELFADWGHAEQAEAMIALAKELGWRRGGGERRAGRERAERERVERERGAERERVARERAEAEMLRLHEIEVQMAEIHEVLEELRHRLEDLRARAARDR